MFLIFLQGCNNSSDLSCIEQLPLLDKSLVNSPKSVSDFEVAAEIEGDNLYKVNGKSFTQDELKELFSNCSGKNTKIIVLNNEGYQTAYFINLLVLLNEKKFEIISLVQ